MSETAGWRGDGFGEVLVSRCHPCYDLKHMPARPSEFEEKEFETPLYNQLECGTRLVWSPGQVFEKYVGIDHALFLTDPALWRFFGVASYPRGAFLHRLHWTFWEQRPRRGLPSFRLNLFIQAKRSYYHKRAPSNIQNRMPCRGCWRFNIDAAQQEAVGKVATRLGSRAVVCYAAPAFHRISELNAHTVRGTIIANSTFPLVQRLAGHGSFYYCAPGGSGIANPDPEDIDGMGLEDLLNNMRSTSQRSSEDTPTIQLQTMAATIESAISDEVPDSNPRRALFTQKLREFERLADVFREPELDIGDSGRAFLRVAAFASAFNLDWYVVD
jgi:hypothetical protein